MRSLRREQQRYLGERRENYNKLRGAMLAAAAGTRAAGISWLKRNKYY